MKENKRRNRSRRHTRRLVRWDRIFLVFLVTLAAEKLFLLGVEADQRETEARAKTCCAPYGVKVDELYGDTSTFKVVETSIDENVAKTIVTITTTGTSSTTTTTTTTTATSTTRQSTSAGQIKANQVSATPNSNLVYSTRLGRYMTEREIYLLTMVCCSEAGFESFEGKTAVVATVLNRMEPKNTAYPNDVYGVIFQPHQFSSATDGVFHTSTAELKWEDLSEKMKTEARKAVEAALNGADPTKKITGGALFFYNPDYCSAEENAKRANISCKQRIGNHVFYRVWN